MHKFKKALKISLLSLGILIGISILNFYYISYTAQDYLYDSTDTIPFNEVGIVLGTSIKTTQGTPNLFFTYRIDAATELYKTNKINYIIVSGDNSTLKYNEPEFMKKALIDKGIPSEKIITDYAGFSTLDSILRAKKVFGQKKYTIISQEFHNQRAVFIGLKNNLEVIGFNAQGVSFKQNQRTYIREVFARLKASSEVLFLKKQPKFLGDPIQIN